MSIEIPLNDRLTVEQAIAAANAAKRSAQQALADIPAVIDAEVGPASAPYITQAVNAKDDAVAAKTASEAARDDALATERRIRTQSLGAFADDAAAVAWAAAQTPPITIVTGASYLNTTSDIFRYAVVSAGPTITWHDVTEDEAAQAALATASAVSAANVKADLDTRFLPAASVDPSYVGGTPPWVNGARYLNTLSGKERVWSGGAWHDYDEAAQAAATTAGDARDAAVAAEGVATTKAGEAAASAAAASGAQGYADSANAANAAAQAALLQTISYAAVAQAQANSVSVATNLSILTAARRAVALMTDGAASFLYDTRRDSDGGAWVDKCVSQSWMTEALGTATRGATAKFPRLALIVGRNSLSSALTIYDATDPTLPMWMVFSGASLSFMGSYAGSGITTGSISIASINGKLFVSYGNSDGTRTIDFISDNASVEYSGSRMVWNGKIADRNLTTLSTVQYSGGVQGLAHNSIAATIAPNTPKNPLRCGLPNPTIAVGTNSGVSVIRWDGVVCNSASSLAYSSVTFDDKGNLWSLYNGGALYACPPAAYQTASFNVTALFSQSLVSPMLLNNPAKVVACGPGMVAVADSTGLARIKLDPTNPAQSLINVKKTTVDAGWQVLGKTAFALAESSGALGAYAGGATITDQSASASNFTVVGGLNRAVVATGADTAGLTGWGVGNYATGAAIALGTADFEFPVSIVGASITGTQTYLSHGYYTGGAYSGARVLLQSSTSTLTATFHDGTNSATISVASALAAGGNYYLRLIYRSALTRFELWSNGVLLGTAARGSVGSLTNASANVFIGIDPALANPTVSTVILALIRGFTYATTPDQIAFMRADEKARFAANAQSLLTGPNVQGVAYDPDTGNVGAANSTGGLDVFNGSVRVANDNSVGLTTNGIRETNFADCVIGASMTGANNTFGTIRRADGVPAGVTVACVGRGFINGCGYVDVQISGTPGATGNLLLYAQSYQTGVNLSPFGVAAASGQQWTAGLGIALAAGALTNIGGIQLSLGGFSSAGGLQEVSYSGTITPTGTISRPTVTRTLNGGATAQVGLYLIIPLTSGQAVNATLRMYQPNLQTGASDVFRDGLTQSANSKAVAMGAGIRAQITAAGLDVNMPATDGLRATSLGVGSAKRAVYDPDKGVYSGVTTDATPNVFAAIPIPEGKALRFFARVASVQYGGTATEKAVYEISGLVTRDIGGNVTVVSTTTTLSEVTASMDCVAQANTAAQTLEIKGTGKAATRMAWVAKIETTDIGLMAAA